MTVITTGAHPSLLWPGIADIFGNDYREFPTEYTDIFRVRNSNKAYEVVKEMSGFGLAPRKPENEALRYDAEISGPETRFTMLAYALGFMVTREEIRDNLYEEVGGRRASALAFSFRQTKEIVHANVLNRAFNTSYTGGDGKPLVATDHPVGSGNAASNRLATDSDLSEASLEDAVTMSMQMTNFRGLRIAVRPRKLVVAAGNWAEAARILNSTNTPGSANNDVNVVRQQFREGVTINHYLTDADAWFVLTDVPGGLISYQRDDMEFERDNDFDTKNAKASGYERYGVGWDDWRGTIGTPGA